MPTHLPNAAGDMSALHFPPEMVTALCRQGVHFELNAIAPQLEAVMRANGVVSGSDLDKVIAWQRGSRQRDDDDLFRYGPRNKSKAKPGSTR